MIVVHLRFGTGRKVESSGGVHHRSSTNDAGGDQDVAYGRGSGEDNAVMGDLLGDSDATKSVHAKGIYCLAAETRGAQCRIIKLFKVKLHLEVDRE